LTTVSTTRIAWAAVFIQCVAIFIWAEVVNRREPEALASSAVTGPERIRFGKSEAERRALYAALVTGEPADRISVAHRDEKAVWNRNRDDYFHELERGRIARVAAKQNIPVWMAWWILDEGIHGHWPPPPGVSIYADDAPLSQATHPLPWHYRIADSPIPSAPISRPVQETR
jgi:hypothetical protein